MLGCQDVQTVRFGLSRGVEVARGGFVEDPAGGCGQDVFDCVFAAAAAVGAAAAAGVGVAYILEAEEGAVDGLDGGAAESAGGGGCGFEAETARLADRRGECPGREEGGHDGRGCCVRCAVCVGRCSRYSSYFLCLWTRMSRTLRRTPDFAETGDKPSNFQLVPSPAT